MKNRIGLPNNATLVYRDYLLQKFGTDKIRFYKTLKENYPNDELASLAWKEATPENLLRFSQISNDSKKILLERFFREFYKETAIEQKNCGRYIPLILLRPHVITNLLVNTRRKRRERIEAINLFRHIYFEEELKYFSNK